MPLPAECRGGGPGLHNLEPTRADGPRQTAARRRPVPVKATAGMSCRGAGGSAPGRITSGPADCPGLRQGGSTPRGHAEPGSGCPPPPPPHSPIRRHLPAWKPLPARTRQITYAGRGGAVPCGGIQAYGAFSPAPCLTHDNLTEPFCGVRIQVQHGRDLPYCRDCAKCVECRHEAAPGSSPCLARDPFARSPSTWRARSGTRLLAMSGWPPRPNARICLSARSGTRLLAMSGLNLNSYAGGCCKNQFSA